MSKELLETKNSVRMDLLERNPKRIPVDRASREEEMERGRNAKIAAQYCTLSTSQFPFADFLSMMATDLVWGGCLLPSRV